MNASTKKRSLMVHTTSRCCSPLISIASRLSIEHGRAGKVTSNCSFKNHIIQSLEQFIQRNRPHWYTEKEKHNIERNITLIRRVSPLEVSTTSFVSVTAWRYNPAKKEQKTKSDTQKTLLLQNWKKKIKSCKSLNDYKATYYIQNQTIERTHNNRGET